MKWLRSHVVIRAFFFALSSFSLHGGLLLVDRVTWGQNEMLFAHWQECDAWYGTFDEVAWKWVDDVGDVAAHSKVTAVEERFRVAAVEVTRVPAGKEVPMPWEKGIVESVEPQLALLSQKHVRSWWRRHLLLTLLSVTSWWEHVETHANPADGGSRQGTSCEWAKKRLGVSQEWVKFPVLPANMADASPHFSQQFTVFTVEWRTKWLGIFL